MNHHESGRSFLSKGLLEEARTLAEKNVALFKNLNYSKYTLIGVEPSAILTFRDEYPDLLRGKEKEHALAIAANTFMIEEFLANELDAGRIDLSIFKDQKSLNKTSRALPAKSVVIINPGEENINTYGQQPGAPYSFWLLWHGRIFRI